MFAMSILFSFVTSPVEIESLRRSAKWLQSTGVTNYSNQPMAIDA